MLLYSWYSYKDTVAGGGWFMTMNFSVHALMYSYYAARAAGLRVPRPLAVLITSAQISQMAMGVAVSALVYRWMRTGDCHSYLDNIVWASLMYLSYLLLFSQFFYQTYLKRGAPPAKPPSRQGRQGGLNAQRQRRLLRHVAVVVVFLKNTFSTSATARARPAGTGSAVFMFCSKIPFLAARRRVRRSGATVP